MVVFFSGSRDPEVTFQGHVMFQVLIKGRFSRRRRDFSIESDCLGPPEAESVEIRHFPRWRNPPFSKMANANRKWFSRGVFRVGIVIFRLFRVVGVQQSTNSSTRTRLPVRVQRSVFIVYFTKIHNSVKYLCLSNVHLNPSRLHYHGVATIA